MSVPKDTKSDEKKPANQSAEMFSAVGHVTGQLEAIEKFMARRFDEISMEINATSQQIDMNEEGTSQRFGEIMEVLKAVSYSGDGSTAANAGVELDAVVEMTEQAANRILDAADRISTRVKDAKDSGDSAAAQDVLGGIDSDIEEIFMACSFQDITGQRIRNTLENLRMIEERLGTALDKIGIQVDVQAEDHTAITNKLSDQGEIDTLFQSEKAKEDKAGEKSSEGKTSSQGDIDDMF